MEWNELPGDVTINCKSADDFQSLSDNPQSLLLVLAALNETEEGPQSILRRMVVGSSSHDIEISQQLQSEIANSSVATQSSISLLKSPDSNDAIAENANTNFHRLVAMVFGTSKKDARKVGTALATLLSAQRKTCSTCAVYLPSNVTKDYLQELVVSIWIKLYKDERYKSKQTAATSSDGKKKKNGPLTLELLLFNNASSSSTSNLTSSIPSILNSAASLARGVYMARDIVNAPHNVLNSLSLAETAQRLARKYKKVLSCRVFDQEECERRKMGAFLAVARGSETPGRFIHLKYTPRNPTKTCRRIALVGKGLLFDTGGYNIKTSMMECMKFDCGGAAAVLGAARAIAELQPPNVEVHFVVAACENMINERAYVPSDILIASNGKTIEVINTDAEGRLTLADALVFADKELQCEEIVEMSTLTGACMVALGSSVAGMWTSDEDISLMLRTASETVGEKLWRMPLNEEDYGDQIKSKIADLKNLGGKHGGAISAALFLRHFVDTDKPFAHIDMAGPVWDYKASMASGWGVKLATEWVRLHTNLE